LVSPPDDGPPDAGAVTQIWVDADACPGAVKEILFRAAARREVALTLVANHAMRVPKASNVRLLIVEQGFDVADNYIAQRVTPGDLVITADIPLAAEIVEKQAVGLNPRGTLYTPENIRDHLARRNFMEELRSSGQVSGGPPALSKTDLQHFANALDRYLTDATKR
jgi:uncharacterized protein YaiI (UPF0178 family)